MEAAAASFGIAGPRIIGILLPSLWTIGCLHDSKIHYYLSINLNLPCCHSQIFSCANLNPLDAWNCRGESDPADPATAAITDIFSKV